MAFNLADLLEAVCDAVPERIAVAAPGVEVSFGELDRRAARLAAAMGARRVGVGDRVALALGNRPAYLEAMFGAFKLRAVPVNVNRYYVLDELRHVLSDAQPALVLGEPALADDLMRAVEGACEVISVGSGYDRLLAGAPAVGGPPATRPGGGATGRRWGRPAGAAGTAEVTGTATSATTDATGTEGSGRSGDDGFLLYTGGSTGRPKGVLWRQEDVFFAALGGGNLAGPPIDHPDDLIRHLAPEPARTMVASPLMHGTAQWSALATLLAGSTVVLGGDAGFDAVAVLDLVERERVAHLVMVGDAFALPLAEALDADPGRWHLDALVVVASGGATLSDAVAQRLLEHLPGSVVVDGYGASETGGQGRRVISPGATPGTPPRFVVGDDSAVLGDDLRPVAPGSGRVGRLARRGRVPLGYRNDPEASARTFPVVDAVRWAVTTDLARLEADGSITLLGRSERVINSGGEKVYPAEVEAAVRAHPDVRDALVTGVPDARFGEAVGVVVQPRAGADLTLEQLQRHCRPHLARFKLPRRLAVVDELPRLPTGKVDAERAALLFAAG